MEFRELSIAGAWQVVPRQLPDERGTFLETFKARYFEETVGRPLAVAQVNCSVSAAGVVRGIHYADVPPSQAKYVTCVHGAVLDVVVDIRQGSPTFGQWESVVLDDLTRHAVFLSEGLGHAFISLADGSTVTYLCSEPYAPGREHGVHALDPAIGIVWPTTARDGAALAPLLSGKDADAPTLAEAAEAGLLPQYSVASAFVAGLGKL